MASLGKDAEESALPCESGRMVRGGLCYVMQHRVVAVHCERRDCRSGGTTLPSTQGPCGQGGRVGPRKRRPLLRGAHSCRDGEAHRAQGVSRK